MGCCADRLTPATCPACAERILAERRGRAAHAAYPDDDRDLWLHA